jgi:hypothetical protein
MNHSAHASHSGAHRVADYIIIVSNEEDYHAGYHHFADKVNRRLKAGYQLHGAPFSVSQVLCQAMVRPVETPPGGETTVFFKPPAHQP